MSDEEDCVSETDVLIHRKNELISSNMSLFYSKIFTVWLVVLCFSSMAVYNIQYGRHPVTGLRNRVHTLNYTSPYNPTQILFTRGTDYEIHFTLKENVTDLEFWLSGELSHPVGNPVGSVPGHYFYSVRLPTLAPGTEYHWGLDPVTRHPFRPFGLNDTICVVGDTAFPQSFLTFKNIKTSKCGLVIHVGDMSYVTNDGGCFRGGSPDCLYTCKGPQCKRNYRTTSKNLMQWDTFFRHVNFSYTPLVTQMGNHDNDEFWYWKFLPVSSNAFLEDTSFYWSSDIIPGLRIISLSTEDNPNDPYERYVKIGDPFDNDRWEKHYGSNSEQYKWFRDQLNTTNKIIVYTHRPPFHTSTHHIDCGPGGSWYRCKMREVWGPLYDNVDYVFSGHSHHWMKTKRGVSVRKSGLISGKRARFVIVGTGGYELETGYLLRPDVLIDQMDNTHHGFVILNYKYDNLTFLKN